MDKKYAIFNLEEAKEHIGELIEELKKSKDLNELDGELHALLLEIYWHINKLWNARNIPQKDIDNSTEDQYDEWCRFPKDIEDM